MDTTTYSVLKVWNCYIYFPYYRENKINSSHFAHFLLVCWGKYYRKIALILYLWWKNLFEFLSTASTLYFEDMDPNSIPVIQLYHSPQSEYY